MFQTGYTPAYADENVPELMALSGGSFIMGDHHGLIDPLHDREEDPLHQVTLTDFSMSKDTITNTQYCSFLNAAYQDGTIEVRNGGVYQSGSDTLFIETKEMTPESMISFDGETFGIQEGKENLPVCCIHWKGAAAYCNWLSKQDGKEVCYDTSNWSCDFTKEGYRLPSEAEWEYAVRGGGNNPFSIFPWGDEVAREEKGTNPFLTSPLPWTTFMGFFAETAQKKSTLFTSFKDTTETNEFDGSIPYRNNEVWEYVNDWYSKTYYTSQPLVSPPRPVQQTKDQEKNISNDTLSNSQELEDSKNSYKYLSFRVVLSSNKQKAITTSAFTLTSSVVTNGGNLPQDYTGDGTSATLPLSWSNAPEGTKSFIIIMHHLAPDGQIKEYWNLYNIPSNIDSIPKNVTGIGILGQNNENKNNAYAPPMSKGPGPKTYILTVYALSDIIEPQSQQVTRDTLLHAMKGLVLAKSSLSVTYTRPDDKIVLQAPPEQKGQKNQPPKR